MKRGTMMFYNQFKAKKINNQNMHPSNFHFLSSSSLPKKVNISTTINQLQRKYYEHSSQQVHVTVYGIFLYMHIAVV